MNSTSFPGFTAAVTNNVKAFTRKVYQSRNSSEREQIFATLEANGVTPDLPFFNSLLQRAASTLERERWWQERERHSLTPNQQSYTPLLRFSPDPATQDAWLQDMAQHNLSPDIHCYASLIAGSDEDRALYWFNTLLEKGFVANTVIYNSLLEKIKAPDLRHARFAEMKANAVVVDAMTYNILIKLAADQAQALLYWEEMLATGLKPDSYTLTARLHWVQNAAEIQALIALFERRYFVLMNVHVARSISARVKHPKSRSELAHIPAMQPYLFDPIVRQRLITKQSRQRHPSR